MSDKTLVERLREVNSNRIKHPVCQIANAVGVGCGGRTCDECGTDTAHALADAIEREFLPRPRVEDGEPVQFGDEFDFGGESHTVGAIKFGTNGDFALFAANEGVSSWYGYTQCDRVKRPRPDVLDADGVPIEVGDVVYDKEATAFRVYDLNGIGITIKLTCIKSGVTFSLDPATLTHKEPDSLERIEADAMKGSCDYFGSRFAQCKGCRAHSRLKGNCSSYQALDLLRRQREVLERGR